MESLFKAYQNSVAGLSWAGRQERAVRLELAMLVLAVPLGALIAGSFWRFAVLMGAVLLVLAVELLNTAIEKLCDYIMPDHQPVIGLVKDLGSAAVLASTLAAGLLWLAALWDFLTR